MNSSLLVFDFDGVIADSIKEQAVTAYNTLHSLRGKPTLATSLEDLPHNFFDRFAASRTRFHHAHTVVLLAYWCEEQEGEPTESSIAALRKTIPHSDSEIRSRFFLLREQFIQSAPKEWAALNPAYPEVWSDIRTQDPLIIVTDKNSSPVKLLFSAWGRPLTTDDVLYSGDNNEPKVENFAKLCKRFPKTSFHFIEDSLVNLKAVYGAFPDKVFGYLASWGYITEQIASSAQAQGFPLLSPEGLKDLITTNAPPQCAK